MPAILPSLNLDSETSLSKHLLPHQVNWCLAEDYIHAQGKQVFALAEKSIRIGWTYGDVIKNVRKRILFKNRDYLFATKDHPSAIEYVRLAHNISGIFDYTRAIVSHGEEYLKVQRLDEDGHPTQFTEDIKIGYIKFDNGSRILAFSSNPQAMAVYGGDVGLDEFAKHPNAELLWETAQGRVTWGYDLAVWSAHDGEDTLFNQFAREARAGAGPWNLYYKVSMPDALELGLLDIINKTRGTNFTPQQFLADCRARSRQDEIFAQAYLCNPLGASTNHIVDWSAIERCRFDYEISRVHLEHDQIIQQFGGFSPASEDGREQEIRDFIHRTFLKLFQTKAAYRLGFDVAASGDGDLAAIYIDEARGEELWLRGLFTCRTDDWHFLQTVLFAFLSELRSVQAAGDATSIGRQICWDAASRFGSKFTCVNFSSKKHDLGFALMNQLATAKKRFPKSDQDIASDFFALHKAHTGTRWAFSEGRNTLNAASHCDIAWAGALATEAHNSRKNTIGARVG